MRAFGLFLLLAAGAASAATRLESVSVRPDRAERQVEIEVTIDRGRFDKQPCEIMVKQGDDSSPTRLSIGVGDAPTRSVRHAYKKDGSYTVRAAAASGCTGTRTASVLVGSQPQTIAPAVAPATPRQAGCPAGWYVVPESVQGSRYSCRPNLPAQALRCEGGTSYFAEGGVIGCR